MFSTGTGGRHTERKEQAELNQIRPGQRAKWHLRSCGSACCAALIRWISSRDLFSFCLDRFPVYKQSWMCVRDQKLIATIYGHIYIYIWQLPENRWNYCLEVSLYATYASSNFQKYSFLSHATLIDSCQLCVANMTHGQVTVTVIMLTQITHTSECHKTSNGLKVKPHHTSNVSSNVSIKISNIMLKLRAQLLYL